jgi:phosphohistidine swiveling domain-containing protein
MNILTHRATRTIAGGKATALADLEAWGLPVPPWFVVTPEAHAACGGLPQDALRREIAHALTGLGEGLYAVRSSAVDEDGADHSFAGQLESYLNVAPDDVPDRVADVWRSGFTERVRTYRTERGLPPEPAAPAVLVQRMIAADSAGVAFSADPVSGRRAVALVSAVAGLGDKLVSGDVDAETWQVDRDGNILSRVAAEEGGNFILTEEFAGRIARLAHAAQAFFGVPQDIEWALSGEKLWLLQSRAITTLGALADPDGELRVWDNSNIAESYGGVTTPLTFSFASRAYEEVYRQFCRIMRVPEQRVEENAETFRGMLGLIQGRVFYNLVNWHRVLALLPGYTMNRGFMEQMMGVKEPLPEGALPTLPAASAGARLRDAFRFAGSLFGLWRNHRTLPKQIRKFYERLNVALADRPLAQMRPDELAAHYRDLETRLLTRWDAPLVNDFFAMIWHGVLRKVCTRWCGDESLANDLIRDQGGIISAEPARRMKELAALAAPSAPLLAALREGSPAEVRRVAGPEFLTALDAYLTKFGDRCLDELKLESATLHDDPALLYSGIAAIAGAGPPRVPPPAADPEVKVAAALRGHPLRRWLFRRILRNARDRVRDRENLRFERTRLFGRVRRIFVELGRRLHSIGRLEGPRDVFYLELHEALGICDGTATTTDLRALVAARVAEFARHQNSPPPPDRFLTRGIPSQVPPAPVVQMTQEGEERRGLGCCPGVVRGKVRVIADPRGAELHAGEILVAERTDPGWVMLFPIAAGLLVERGSLLSHSAIVSRELGLPAVVSVTGLTSWLRTGDEVEFDGSTGNIRRLAAL